MNPGVTTPSPTISPFANRVKDHVFTFEGKVYTLPADSGNHSIHGLVRSDWATSVPEEKKLIAGVMITSDSLL